MKRPVLEKRSCPRVSLAASGLLVYREGMYRARLENISLAGALLTLDESDIPDIARGERCSVALSRPAGRPLLFKSRLVHYGDHMVCVRFLNLDLDTRLMLRSIISHQMPERRAVPVRGMLCRH